VAAATGIWAPVSFQCSRHRELRNFEGSVMTFTTPDASTRPLEGVTVLDLSRVLAGPFCTMLLAQLGARVIKVEQPGPGDDSRAFGPFVKGKSSYFASINYDKESIALNLKERAHRAIFEKLLGVSDVVVENFRPGTMEKLG
jgi:CoA:oxalate CoA-transferase